METRLTAIAHIHSPFPEKFGIPRQSGLVESIQAEIRFEPMYRNPDVIKGIEEFSHLWLIWEFSENKREHVSLTVSPPRLGGNEKRGVFATRSPFRPNPLGLSCVRLKAVRMDENLGPVLLVEGADLLDGTPIYDIKPYLPYADCHPSAKGGFGEAHKEDKIPVIFPEEERTKLPEKLRETVCELLAQDPRAAYNKKENYVYGMAFDAYDIRFMVRDNCLFVQSVEERKSGDFRKIK